VPKECDGLRFPFGTTEPASIPSSIVMTKIQCAIVDDEPLAREALREMIGTDDGLEVAGEYRNGRSVMKALEATPYDLLFLDIRMPRLSGFDLLEQLRHPQQPSGPAIVFVTAFECYAAEAFDHDVIDYLLKPFDLERVRRTLGRVHRHFAGEPALAHGAGADDARPELPARLAIRGAGQVDFIRVESIDWLETAGNYVRLHVGTRSHLFRTTMDRMEQRLDPRRFVRIHRSTIVNIDHVVQLRPAFRRDYQVRLADGTRLRLSSHYRARLEALVDGL
jgi:two-component system LytT family response regulator